MSDLPDDKGGSPPSTTPIEIDGKQYSLDDVKNILAQQAEVTKKSQLASKALTAAERYGVDVDSYVQNAEASFALMNEMIQAGIIDESGKLLKKEMPKADPPPKAAIPQLGKADVVATEALVEFHKKFGDLEAEINRLREDNVGLMRLRLQDKLADQFPDLDENDISQVMATAYKSGGKKPVAEVAKEFSDRKKEWMANQEIEFAKKYGLNLDEVKRKQMFKEQDPSTGAGVLFNGKQFSFRGKKGDSTISPREAMKEFLSKRLGD